MIPYPSKVYTFLPTPPGLAIPPTCARTRYVRYIFLFFVFSNHLSESNATGRRTHLSVVFEWKKT